jgi:hypothetical protein
MVGVRRWQSELLENPAHMLLDRAFADHEVCRNRGVGAPLGHEPEHLPLPRRELRERPAAGDELPHDLGIERGSSFCDTFDRGDEVARVGDALLEEVTDPTHSVGEQLRCIRLLDVLRENEHGEPGNTPACLDRRAQSLVAKARREADVDHRHVRTLRHRDPQEA